MNDEKNSDTIILEKQIEALAASIDKVNHVHMLPLMLLKTDLENKLKNLK